MTPLALLSGIPGSGKSTFGRWLEREHGFIHIDLENAGLDRVGFSDAWASVAILPPPNVHPFVLALRRLERPIALDSVFPLRWFPVVKALHEAGVAAWWFDGDRDAARAMFLERGTVSEAALVSQMRDIDNHKARLDAFYQKRIINSIRADRSFASANAIFDAIFGGR